MSSLEKFVNSNKLSLTKSDLAVCEFLIKNSQSIPKMTLLEVAEETFSSKSNILRLLKKLGFSGFTDFKYFLLAQNDKINKQQELREIFDRMDSIDIESISKQFNQLVHSANNIYLLATGEEQHIQAKSLENYFLKKGILSTFVPLNINSELTNTVLATINPADLIIIFSSKGDNDSLKYYFKNFTKKDASIIAFTGYKYGWIQDKAKLSISLEMKQLQDTTSFFQSGMMHLLLNILTLKM